MDFKKHIIGQNIEKKHKKPDKELRKSYNVERTDQKGVVAFATVFVCLWLFVFVIAIIFESILSLLFISIALEKFQFLGAKISLIF